LGAAGNDWLRMLIAPGGSLGGARPKACVVDPGGRAPKKIGFAWK
jgi:serine/threonine-protein kinase HipA